MRRAWLMVGVLSAVMLASTMTAMGNPKPMQVDKAHSQINFVAQSRLLDAHGFFGQWDAKVGLDPTAWGASTVDLTIQAASIDTRVEKRDAHLRSADFFDVERFPTIRFVSTQVKATDATHLSITGSLTVHGVTKTVTVPATIVFVEGGMARFRGQFTVDRTAYGITYDSALNPIKSDVEVQWDMALTTPPAK